MDRLVGGMDWLMDEPEVGWGWVGWLDDWA